MTTSFESNDNQRTSNTQFPDGADDDQERDLWRGGFSAKSMMGAWIGAALITGAIVFGVLNIAPLRETKTVWATMIALIGLVWILLVGLAIWRKLGQHYEITTQRLKHRSGVFMRQMDRIELIDIDDVSYRQGPLQALLNVGTIELLSSDTSHPKLKLPGIANVSSVANMIDDARRTERRKRGLHVESI